MHLYEPQDSSYSQRNNRSFIIFTFLRSNTLEKKYYKTLNPEIKIQTLKPLCIKISVYI